MKVPSWDKIEHIIVTDFLPLRRNSIFIRSCMLRMMCEVQHVLHPKGYSLLHDMLRAIFT
jgi:hypothetical protein